MEGFIFICKRKLNIAVERTKELTFFHESLLTVTREHVIKMNVVLIKGCIHIYSQTENAFSVDREWACESNTIQQNINLIQNACMQGGHSWTTGRTIVSDTNKILSRDISRSYLAHSCLTPG